MGQDLIKYCTRIDSWRLNIDRVYGVQLGLFLGSTLWGGSKLPVSALFLNQKLQKGWCQTDSKEAYTLDFNNSTMNILVPSQGVSQVVSVLVMPLTELALMRCRYSRGILKDLAEARIKGEIIWNKIL